MSLVVMFPGQGVQHPGMLRWVDDHPLAAPALQAMARHIGADWRTRLTDTAWATSNTIAQCLVTGLSLAAWQVLSPRLPRPVAMAGYSVGELAAAAAAGLYGIDEALELAALRAQAMDRAAQGIEGSLMSVPGLDEHEANDVCSTFGLAVAIHLGPDRRVLGGPVTALADATRWLAQRGLSATPLQVRVASHTPWMASAAATFAAAITPRAWRAAGTLVVSNLTGEGRRDVPGLKQALAGQIDHPVQWARSIETLFERHPSCVLEVGPGQSLSRMWQSQHPHIPVRSAEEFHHGDAVVAWSRQHLEV